MNNKRVAVWLRNLLLCVIGITLLCAGTTASAMNLDYLQSEKWYNNPNVTYEDLDLHSALGYDLTGCFRYYADNDLCLYTYFSFSETSMTEENHDVRIEYTYYIGNETYGFAVTADGLEDVVGEEVRKQFETAQNFNPEGNLSDYIAAVQYKGNESACTVDIRLHFTDHNYLIKQGLYFELPTTTKPEKETTTAKTTTAKTTTERTTKPPTTKPERTSPTAKVTKETPTEKPTKETTTTEKATTTLKETEPATTKFVPSYCYTTQTTIKETTATTAKPADAAIVNTTATIVTTTATTPHTVPEQTTTAAPAAAATSGAGQTTQSTTKFVPSNTQPTTQKKESTKDMANTVTDAALTEKAEQTQSVTVVKATLSPANKRLLVIAVLAALAGLILLAVGAGKHNSKETEPSEQPEEEA